MKPDREKVINGLNDIHAVACGLGDDECYLNSIGIKQLQTLINDATELLRAQEAVPVSIKDSDGGTTHWYVCGSCQAPIQLGDNYCHECGKAVRWE